jgi:hypothetical protein
MEAQYKKYGITVDQAEIVNAMRTQPIQELVRSQVRLIAQTLAHIACVAILQEHAPY